MDNLGLFSFLEILEDLASELHIDILLFKKNILSFLLVKVGVGEEVTSVLLVWIHYFYVFCNRYAFACKCSSCLKIAIYVQQK